MTAAIDDLPQEILVIIFAVSANVNIARVCRRWRILSQYIEDIQRAAHKIKFATVMTGMPRRKCVRSYEFYGFSMVVILRGEIEITYYIHCIGDIFYAENKYHILDLPDGQTSECGPYKRCNTRLEKIVNDL